MITIQTGVFCQMVNTLDVDKKEIYILRISELSRYIQCLMFINSDHIVIYIPIRFFHSRIAYILKFLKISTFLWQLPVN